MVLQWVPTPLAAVVEEVLDEPQSSDAVGCPSVQPARVGLRAGRSDAVEGCATSSCSAGMPLIGEMLGHVGCTAKGPPAEAWTHTASGEGSTWTAEAFVETSAGRTCSSDGRDRRATRRTQASWTEASGKSGGIVYASSRPSYLAYLGWFCQLESSHKMETGFSDWETRLTCGCVSACRACSAVGARLVIWQGVLCRVLR